MPDQYYDPKEKRMKKGPRPGGEKETFDKEKYQGFTAGGDEAPPEDKDAPKRKDFPGGLGGEAEYQKAMRAYKAKHQRDAIKESK